MRLRKQKRRPWGDVAGEANPQTFGVRRSARTLALIKTQTLTKTIRIYIMIRTNSEAI
jgi:hypothetical protein